MAGASNPNATQPANGSNMASQYAPMSLGQAFGRSGAGMGGKGGAANPSDMGDLGQGMSQMPVRPSSPVQPAQPTQVTQPGAPNVMQTSANLYNAAAAGPNINQFMNPFTENVVNTTMGAMDRSRNMALDQLGAQATAARAFGGSRHGVAEAETNRGFFDQAGQMAAQLNSQGFNTALSAAQANQGMQAQLAQQGFNMGNTLNQQQLQQGSMQQALQQQLIDAAKAQYGGFTGSPMQALQTMLASVGGANMGQQSQTTSKQPGIFDYLTLGATMICWVAREVYGEDDPRWIEFRQWLLADAPMWLLRAYIKHGEAFAGVVRKVPVLKRVLRPLMDRARRSAGFAG